MITGTFFGNEGETVGRTEKRVQGVFIRFENQ